MMEEALDGEEDDNDILIIISIFEIKMRNTMSSGATFIFRALSIGGCHRVGTAAHLFNHC